MMCVLQVTSSATIPLYVNQPAGTLRALSLLPNLASLWTVCGERVRQEAKGPLRIALARADARAGGAGKLR